MDLGQLDNHMQKNKVILPHIQKLTQNGSKT